MKLPGQLSAIQVPAPKNTPVLPERRDANTPDASSIAGRPGPFAEPPACYRACWQLRTGLTPAGQQACRPSKAAATPVPVTQPLRAKSGSADSTPAEPTASSLWFTPLGN